MNDLYMTAIHTLPPGHVQHRNSTLLLKMSMQSIPLVKQYRREGGDVQRTQDENRIWWYEIPFAYTPYWHRNLKSLSEEYAWRFFSRNESRGTLGDTTDENLRRTFAMDRNPPPKNMYPLIRSCLSQILSMYGYLPQNPSSLRIPA